MQILLFHPTILPPQDYGGVERVVLWLAEGLVERGHQVIVAALPGSQLPEGCALLEVEKKNYSKEEFLSLLQKQGPRLPDLIHFHAPISEPLWTSLPIPALLTVHGNGQPGEKYPKNSVFLSADHARRHGAETYIFNGINPTEYIFSPQQKKDWYLFLSKTSWSVKNLAGAMKYSRKAGVSLRVAGGNRPFLKRMQCTFHPRLTWIGPVGGLKKAQVLAEAKALLFPVTWPEPFGLVVVESLISGTPVIASPQGSLKELVTPDVGILPQSEEEWVEALQQRSLPWNPEHCRKVALEKFHYLKMAEKYEQAYKKVAEGQNLNQDFPIGTDWRTA
jgi:glycosyltransferase involved in cell wall biosynthesis